MIPSLADQLEVNSANKISKELEQAFAQEKAEFKKIKTKSVLLKKDNPSWLVTSIKVEKSKYEFKLIFINEKGLETIGKDDNQKKAEFVLAISNLRQWLNALFKIYNKAEWDTKCFPNWIDDFNLKYEKKILIN